MDDQPLVENNEGQPEQNQDASPDDKSAANFKVVNKVNQLQTQLNEANIEKERVQQELENSKQNFHEFKKALTDEIDALKERERSLKSTNLLLQKGLEEQKRANLDNASAQKNQSVQEQEAILQERIQKADAELERMRGERLVALEENKKLKQQYQDKEILISKFQAEHTRQKSLIQQNQVSIKQLQDLNQENQILKQEIQSLRDQLTEAIKNAGKTKELVDVKQQLIIVQTSFDELKASVVDKEQKAGQPDGAAPDQKNNVYNQIFKQLMTSLSRARNIIQVLEKTMGDLEIKNESAPDEQQIDSDVNVGQKR